MPLTPQAVVANIWVHRSGERRSNVRNAKRPEMKYEAVLTCDECFGPMGMHLQLILQPPSL